MTEQERADIYEEGRQAGADIRVQAIDCPYDHSLPDELPRRQRWMEGFAAGRTSIADADREPTEPPVPPHSQIPEKLPVYVPR